MLIARGYLSGTWRIDTAIQFPYNLTFSVKGSYQVGESETEERNQPHVHSSRHFAFLCFSLSILDKNKSSGSAKVFLSLLRVVREFVVGQNRSCQKCLVLVIFSVEFSQFSWSKLEFSFSSISVAALVALSWRRSSVSEARSSPCIYTPRAAVTCQWLNGVLDKHGHSWHSFLVSCPRLSRPPHPAFLLSEIKVLSHIKIKVQSWHYPQTFLFMCNRRLCSIPQRDCKPPLLLGIAASLFSQHITHRFYTSAFKGFKYLLLHVHFIMKGRAVVQSTVTKQYRYKNPCTPSGLFFFLEKNILYRETDV